MEFWQTLIISLCSGTTGGGFLYFILTEKIKSKIQHEYNLKFEFARNELEQKATKFQIQYSKLHIDRAEKLKEIYNCLINAENSLTYYTHFGQGTEWIKDSTRENQAKKDFEALKKTTLENRIYFEENLCNTLESIIEDYRKIIHEMDMTRSQSEYEQSSGLRSEPTQLQKWISLGHRVTEEMVNNRKAIEGEFRRILGLSE